MLTYLLTYLLPVFIVEQNLVGISAFMLVMIHRHLGMRMTCHGAIRHYVGRFFLDAAHH